MEDLIKIQVGDVMHVHQGSVWWVARRMDTVEGCFRAICVQPLSRFHAGGDTSLFAEYHRHGWITVIARIHDKDQAIMMGALGVFDALTVKGV